MLAGRVEPPVVTLHASEVESLSPTTAVVRFALAVANPNAFGLSARAVGCELRLDNQAVAEGANSERVALAAHATSMVEVHMKVPFPVLSTASPDAIVLGEVPYELDGRLRFGSFFAERELIFAVSSVLRLSPPVGLARWLSPNETPLAFQAEPVPARPQCLRSPPEAGTPASSPHPS